MIYGEAVRDAVYSKRERSTVETTAEIAGKHTATGRNPANRKTSLATGFFVADVFGAYNKKSKNLEI